MENTRLSRPELQPESAIMAYVRSSGEEGHLEPVDDQFFAIKAWAAANGHRIVGRYSDRVPGDTDLENRPGFARALASIRDQKGVANAVVCLRTDRAFRDGYVGLAAKQKLEELGCRLLGIDDPPALHELWGESSASEKASDRARK